MNKFQKGELVKAFFKSGGLGSKMHAAWHIATYHGRTTKPGYKVCHHGKSFVTNRVMKWLPLSDEDLQYQCGKQFQELAELTESAVKDLLDNRPYWKVKRSDMNMVELGDGISIYPVAIEITTLDSFKEVSGWCVVTYRHYPGTRIDPPDVVENLVGNERTIEGAVALAVRTAWEQDSDNFWRGVAEEHLAEEAE
jgi:hypothetical protein